MVMLNTLKSFMSVTACIKNLSFIFFFTKYNITLLIQSKKTFKCKNYSWMKYKYNSIFIPFNYYRRTIIRLVYNFPVMMWQYSRIRWMFAWIFSKKKNSTKLQSLGSNLLGFSRLREKKTMYKKLIPLLIIHFFLKKKNYLSNLDQRKFGNYWVDYMSN